MITSDSTRLMFKNLPPEQKAEIKLLFSKGYPYSFIVDQVFTDPVIRPHSRSLANYIRDSKFKRKRAQLSYAAAWIDYHLGVKKKISQLHKSGATLCQIQKALAEEFDLPWTSPSTLQRCCIQLDIPIRTKNSAWYAE